MSDARIKPYPGWLIHPEHNDKALTAIIEAQFDAETDQEEVEYVARQKNEIVLRKLCVLRILALPIDLVVGIPLFGLQFAKKRVIMVKDMVKFIFKKISTKEVLRSIEDNI